MPRTRKFGAGRRKFYGNRFTSKEQETQINTSNGSGESEVMVQSSASKKKLKYLDDSYSSNFSEEKIPQMNSGSVIIELSVVCSLLNKCLKCKYCDSESSIELLEDVNSRKGLASKLIIMCSVCGHDESVYTSGVNNKRLYNVNTRLAYGMRCIGKGYKATQTFCAIMDLPPPPRFDRYNKVLLGCLEDVSSMSLKTAVKESVEKNDGNCDIAAAFDGSWQKRGHTSLNGVVTATSLESGKVIDVECLTKYCSGCKSGGKDHTCAINFEGYSGGMESEGVLKIFNRSEHLYGVRYTQYLGDGDSKGFQKVCEAKPYGASVTIEKMECVGHVQKRLGTRLRKLRKDLKGQKLSDGKYLTGRGRLTDGEIDLLQRYYGLAIRRNEGNLVDMRKAVWASLIHKSSTDEHPCHALCPTGPDTWCKFQEAKANNTVYQHKHSLPYAVVEAIKPIYRDLSNPKLLEKCLHGRTQNPNECFNRCIWDRVPKTVFVGLQTLKIGVLDAVICFNEGTSSRCMVLEQLGMEAGYNMRHALTAIDRRRVAEAERMFKETSKEARTRKRNTKRKKEDEELLKQDDYGAGMH